MLDFLKNKLTVGRGATAIYLLLKAKFDNADVVVPANICYAAIYPIVYSSNNPVFCDVDMKSGNITLKTLSAAITENTKAVIVPHMYGNPVAEIQEIADFCRQKKLILIEDCASAMGAELNGKKLGTFGDYAVFSTGYSKTIDLGDGGILASDFSLDRETELYATLDLFDGGAAVSSAEFSKSYRAFRNSKKDIKDSEFFGICHSDLYKNYIYRLPSSFDITVKEKIETQLERVVEQRRNEAALYSSLIKFDDILKPYEYLDGAVPWRFNIYIAPAVRDAFVKALLESGVPVSDWYPVSAIIFDDYSLYENALSAEKSILNFPLLIGDEKIREICSCINKVKDGMNNGVN